MRTCTRCGQETDMVAWIPPRPRGMTWFTPSSDFNEMTLPPRDEYVCAACVTPLEVSRDSEVGSLIEFVLTGLQGRDVNPTTNVALEHVKTIFMVRNNLTPKESEQRARDAALRVMGLTTTNQGEAE